jgi:hypothetical protein
MVPANDRSASLSHRLLLREPPDDATSGASAASTTAPLSTRASAASIRSSEPSKRHKKSLQHQFVSSEPSKQTA